VAGPEGVKGTFPWVEEGRHPTLLAERAHPLSATGEQLVGVGLVAHVEDEIVLRGVEHPVEGDDQLHRAQRGPEVAADLATDGDDLLPELGAESGQHVLGQRADDPGRLHAPEDAHLDRSTLYRARAARGPGEGSSVRTAASASATRLCARARDASTPSTAG
jgi:hypothetical protein